jgi:fumarate reductase subunit C
VAYSANPRGEPRRQLIYELVSGASGLTLAVFMWGHMLMVGSILAGRRGFNAIAQLLEDFYLAQPAVVGISALFLTHAVFASRKIPAQLRERRQFRDLAAGLKGPAAIRTSSRFAPHLESMLWIWQVRTGMVILVIGSFHLVLVGIDILTPLFGERTGIEAVSSMSRVAAGLWPLYGLLLVCVEFHAGVGLYRLAVKWGLGAGLSRIAAWRVEQVLLWAFLGLGVLTLTVLAGWMEPPLAFLFEA